jgi:predicted lipoprotein with Yx(FWY)xxD motif
MPTRSAASIGVSGGHLVDANGFALYDTPAACTGTCLTVWPPFDASQVPVAKAGVSQAAIALSAGQVTYNGHLLFYFDTDTAPGMVNGSGVNGFTLVSP